MKLTTTTILGFGWRFSVFGTIASSLLAYWIAHKVGASFPEIIAGIWAATAATIVNLWGLIRITYILQLRKEVLDGEPEQEETPTEDRWRTMSLAVDVSPCETIIAQFDAPQWQNLNTFMKGIRTGKKPNFKHWKNQMSEATWTSITKKLARVGMLRFRIEGEPTSGYVVTRLGWQAAAGWTPNPSPTETDPTYL